MNKSTSERRVIDATLMGVSGHQESHTVRLANISADKGIVMTTWVTRSSDHVGILHDWMIRTYPGAPTP
jgi:hypothetical protein